MFLIKDIMPPKLKVKDLPKIERPREKLVKYGPDKLSNDELLAIILRTGRKGENVIELSRKVLARYETKNISEVTYDQLLSINGLGPTKVCEIIACFELGKRFLRDKKTILMLTPKDVWNELIDLRDKKKEHFIVFYLDSRNQEIIREIISIGTINTSLVHPREVFEHAVKNLATHILIAHNHPSGILEPSEDDIEVTKRIKKSGEILGIGLIDHVIVSKEGFYSFRENNKL